MTEKFRWIRTKDGIIAGVCGGLAKNFELEPSVVRILWAIGTCLLWIPFFLYFVLAIALPREDLMDQAMKPKILGVCLRLSKKYDIDIGLMRLLAILGLLASFGLMILAYFVVHIVLVSEEHTRS